MESQNLQKRYTPSTSGIVFGEEAKNLGHGVGIGVDTVVGMIVAVGVANRAIVFCLQRYTTHASGGLLWLEKAVAVAMGLGIGLSTGVVVTVVVTSVLSIMAMLFCLCYLLPFTAACLASLDGHDPNFCTKPTFSNLAMESQNSQKRYTHSASGIVFGEEEAKNLGFGVGLGVGTVVGMIVAVGVVNMAIEFCLQRYTTLAGGGHLWLEKAVAVAMGLGIGLSTGIVVTVVVTSIVSHMAIFFFLRYILPLYAEHVVVASTNR